MQESNELAAEVAEKSRRLIEGLQRDAAEVSAAVNVADKNRGEATLAAAIEGAGRVLKELENIRE